MSEVLKRAVVHDSEDGLESTQVVDTSVTNNPSKKSHRDPGGIPPRIPAGTGILPRSRQDPANAAISRRDPNREKFPPGSRQESWRVDFPPGSRQDSKLSRRDPAMVKFSPRFPARISPGILFLPGSRQEKITAEKHCGNKSR